MNEHSLEHFDEERESILTLPIRKKDLGQFVIDLLGQQQTIERIYEEPFDFDLNWFINLHELINQRINQQNHSTLVSFSFIVYFESGLKRSITSIEALQGYNETKKDIPCGVKIIWNYLVQFPAKNHPEKQVISFSAFRQKNKKIELDGISPIGIISRIYSSKSERRIISVQIDHTERTWGDDLEVIISNHIDEGLRKNSWNLFYDIVRSVTTLSMLIGGIIFGFYSSITLKMDQIKTEITKYADLNKNIEIG